MRRRKKQNISEESYWKSATDIMAGVVLVVMLVVMLLLLYLMQMRTGTDTHHYDHNHYYEATEDHDDQDNTVPSVYFTSPYVEPRDPHSGGGNGGGEDDPGTEEPEDHFPDEGHDKTAVFVTVVDEETGNVIKKDGILFELYADKNAKGGLQTLHTYYPEKIEYKQYQTTKDGTFYLPEKITRGWYSFHNLKPPEGYGTAEDFNFQITEPLDWPEPFLVEIPMSPSKNRIYVRNVDSETNERIGGEVYEVYAARDIVTLDGTVRYKQGQKVDEIKCDEKGDGSSKKLFLGDYYLSQKTSAQFYARFRDRIDVTVKLTDTEKDAAVIRCDKTKVIVTLTDEYTGDPIKGAVYAVPGREYLSTNENGMVIMSDLEKETDYTLTLTTVPKPYKIISTDVTFKVDKDGLIFGEATYKTSQTIYMTRLTVDVKDIVFKNSIDNMTLELVNDKNVSVKTWDTDGVPRVIEGLDPGTYSLVINGNPDSKVTVTLKDTAEMQKCETSVWTMWDTILVVASVLVFGLIVFITIRIILRVRRKRKANERTKDLAEKE